MKLVVGLGNPGREYSGTRHNIGFAVLGEVARKNGINFDKRCCHSRTGEGRIVGQEVALAKPQTYMNLSGDAVASLMRRYRVKLSDLLIVHDDLDLPLGKIRLRANGSAGGHNGLKSIIASIGSMDFARLKVGIGRPESPGVERRDVVDHVLTNFGGEERKIADDAIGKAAEAIEMVVEQGLEAAMNRFNGVETRPVIE
ncbi:aminoacyl-tRNA hydrolase [Dehalogenimonas alkenigignens]|uniref:Peptidyl-tRNA hydrolase n=1 Tax=Dehalogenimonas alkenigignens TaxID=1217799 RepID=A0A0W0GIW0_9CHLR|nr:aminoacyl-tRNA hydrolase [Dehalogenimonas alkenigignens]KTB48476.1 peptidyl-tRNA hydrolase [Dehalogenimonas alkenigignens]PVV85074.1 aminoacyl-tRNA hydrolase [Dehalogenimonas alkenigignens]